MVMTTCNRIINHTVYIKRHTCIIISNKIARKIKKEFKRGIEDDVEKDHS